MMHFLPPRKIKCLSLHPFISSFNTLHLSFPSLSLGLKRLRYNCIISATTIFWPSRRLIRLINIVTHKETNRMEKEYNRKVSTLFFYFVPYWTLYKWHWSC
jgi:hypothetical protein